METSFHGGVLHGGRPITDARGWQSGILGDFWRSWPGHFKSLFFFLPPPSILQTTTRPRPSLELTSSCLCNLRRKHKHTRPHACTQAPAGTPRDIRAEKHADAQGGRKKSAGLFTWMRTACPQFIMHKHSVVLIISDA